ncbi:hypothetical protein BDR26DRAFT_865772 [Obelidium mucronatum]|nr:hypothetical protein BDR26DRAFT_865772 [Obelidium mucronatum]
MAIERLKEFYGIDDINALPIKATMSSWTNTNKFNFVKGVLTYSLDRSQYIADVYSVFGSDALPRPGSIEEANYINLLYNRHLQPFKKYGPNGSAASTPLSSTNPSVSSFIINLDGLTQMGLRQNLIIRDQSCLFCWVNLSLDAAQIIAQKSSIPLIIDDLLIRCNLESIFQVQNGILLCKICHDQFDILKRYIDVNDSGQLVAKVVNSTNDMNNDDDIIARDTIEANRRVHVRRLAGREVINADGEMTIYFVENDRSLAPNRKALQLHKAACLIWKMAGGADVDRDDELEEDPGDIGVLASEKLGYIQAWREQSASAGTLTEGGELHQ